MSPAIGYTCACCGQHHAELPLSYRTKAPEQWNGRRGRLNLRLRHMLTSDECVINREHFFVQGNLEIPILDSDEVFAWGVWVSLSKTNFARAHRLWTIEGRESEPPYFGWLSTELPIYGTSTMNLKTNVHTREVGRKPHIELQPTDHPLAQEQRNGITLARVQEIAEAVLHPAKGRLSKADGGG